MDRISGWYKRETQQILFWIGLALVVLLNVDTIAIVRHLSTSRASPRRARRNRRPFPSGKAGRLCSASWSTSRRRSPKPLTRPQLRLDVGSATSPDRSGAVQSSEDRGGGYGCEIRCDNRRSQCQHRCRQAGARTERKASGTQSAGGVGGRRARGFRSPPRVTSASPPAGAPSGLTASRCSGRASSAG